MALERLTLQLRVQPVRLIQGDWVAQSFGGYQQREAFNVGIPVSPGSIRVTDLDSGRVSVPKFDGTVATYVRGLPRNRLSIRLQHLTPEEARTLRWMLRSGRPLTLGWFDGSTHWMSHFGGYGREAPNFRGVAEVGDTDSDQVFRRTTAGLEYFPHPLGGENVLRNDATTTIDASTVAVPKIVPGMIGGAILLEASRSNLAVRRFAAAGASVWANITANVLAMRTANIGGCFSRTGQKEVIQIPYTAGQTEYAETGDQTVTSGQAHCATFWARGDGGINPIWVQGGSPHTVGPSYSLDPLNWKKIVLRFTPSSGTGRVRMAPTVLSTTAALVQTEGMMLEKGSGPTSLIDSTTVPTISDQIWISDTLNLGAGFTMVWWFKYRNDADKKTFFSASLGSGAADFWAELVADNFTFFYNGAGNSASGAIGGVEDQWMQVALVVGRASAVTNAKWRIAIYANGALVTGLDVVNTQVGPNLATGAIYVGCDAGKATPSLDAMNMPLDAFRLDERPWTSAEVLADYDLRSNAGARALIEETQGRYYEPSTEYAPDSQIYFDKYLTDLVLDEVDSRRQSRP